MITIHGEGVKISQWAKEHGLCIHVFVGKEGRDIWHAALASPDASIEDLRKIDNDLVSWCWGATEKWAKKGAVENLVYRYNQAKRVLIDGKEVNLPFLTAEGIEL